jgi:hypothetical protein
MGVRILLLAGCQGDHIGRGQEMVSQLSEPLATAPVARVKTWWPAPTIRTIRLTCLRHRGPPRRSRSRQDRLCH